MKICNYKEKEENFENKRISSEVNGDIFQLVKLLRRGSIWRATSAVPTFVKYSKQGILIVAKIHSSCACVQEFHMSGISQGMGGLLILRSLKVRWLLSLIDPSRSKYGS